LYPVELNPDGTPKYTDMQWIQLLLVRQIRQWVYMAEKQDAINTANASIVVDDTIVN
jgi:hypothetical protein